MNRTHSFKNTTYRGFTLIELLVVIAIIGLLSTIIAAPIQNARKKARDSKKIAEIKGVQLALDQYAEANAGAYPVNLGLLAPVYMPLLPGFAPAASSTTVSPRDLFAYTPYEVSGNSLKGTFFAYHMGVHLENFSQALDNDSDCMGAENKNGYSLVNGTTTCAFYPATGANVNWLYSPWNVVPGMIFSPVVTVGAVGTASTYQTQASATSSSDFKGTDGSILTCNGTEDCVFDVTAQQ